MLVSHVDTNKRGKTTVEDDRRHMSSAKTIAAIFVAAAMTMLPCAKASGA